VQGRERDPQRFWIAVADALRGTAAAAALVRPLAAAPDLDGWAVVERLLADLDSLDERIWLVIDDVHELASAEALAQLELLVLRAPPELRFVLAIRHDLRLGLHRLRLEGQLTEIRGADLRFTLDEAQALFDAAGVPLPDVALTSLYARTECWAAGLRLAALSLAGHPDPERFASEFSGSERTVADYLLAEVLERQPEEVRRLLLRTSMLERVNGELADLLTGGSGGERILQNLEQTGAFVTSLDARRSWFRYHELFADLLQLELRRSAPGEVAALHTVAAGWFARHGFPVEAVRHAQAAQSWGQAARLIADLWLSLALNGQGATAHELLTRFPAGVVAADAELTALVAADELTWGSLEKAERYLARAAQQLQARPGPIPVPPERRERLQVFLAMVRLWLARRRGDLPAVAEEAQRLFAPAEATDATRLGLGEDLRAQAMITLGIAEVYAERLEDAGWHLEQGVALARRIGRPYLELTGLVHSAVVAQWRSLRWERSGAGRRSSWRGGTAGVKIKSSASPTRCSAPRCLSKGGWRRQSRGSSEPSAPSGPRLNPPPGFTSTMPAGPLTRPAVVTPTLWPITRPLSGWPKCSSRRTTALRGRDRTCCRRSCGWARPSASKTPSAGWTPVSATPEMRTTLASLRLAKDDPRAATTALAPVIDGSIPRVPAL
jgi:LuxR family maltose regulon positive regulatory protein